MKARIDPPIPSARSVALLGCLALAGCGGGGSSPPSASTSSVSGVVLDGPIQGATVCLDVNANQLCDSGEPTSAPTDAQGNYTITGLTEEQRNSGKEWIASVPAGATDGSTTFTTPFVLRTAADKPAIISPFTHMVQVGLDQGAANAGAAAAAVAAQLGVDAATLHGNYVAGSPGGDNALLAAHAPGVVSLLLAGAQPTVALPSVTAADPYTVRRFAYTDAANYVMRIYYPGTVNGQSVFYDVRGGLSAGNPLGPDSLYDTARYLDRSGWVRLGPDLPNSNSQGNPSTSFTAGAAYANLRQVSALRGKTVTEAIALANDATLNTAPTLPGVPMNLAGVLPDGAKASTLRSTAVRTAVYHYTAPGNTVSEGYANPALTTLDSVLSAFPVSSTPTGGNTLSMGNLQANASYGCPAGQASCVIPQQRLRAQIDAGNTVRWILCDLSWPSGGTAGGCQAIGSGSYARATGIDGQTPLLTFSGLPAQADAMSYVRVYAETGGQVWFALQDKPTTAVTTRLNDVAFAPIVAQLGVTVPGRPN